ncbi:enoyl-CoA hydratase [Pseudomonas sp. B21-040]|jgi:enoyl-CoA hydratase/carnithine racemase|uniref:enoyl-CoA hydratase n=1 Tax=unclassified Pseudomonas TaxID=196821 RepID=UPI000D6C8863|nr:MULTISPECIES: enoyl-CoA hydratase [unclassified Pseudomonas]PWK32999.1 enoyl-CoA hydratase [Pseudomonas sp. OV226]UVL38741.1 enoyl-CoA hydratase [Pseudomonas sp. B21-040]
MSELIKHDRNEGVLTLTLDRPDKLNALNNSLYTQLADRLLAADEDDDVGVIVLTGGPTCFTSGNDLADFLEHPPTHLDSPAFRLMNVVIHLQKPLIAAVCGAAIGIGTTLLMHCDQVLVTRNAKLRTPFVNLGLCPEFGASLLLPRLLGHARAARLLLWGDSLDGAAAVACGLANELFDDGQQCLAAAQILARRLLALPQESLRQTRQLLKQASLPELKATIRQENLLFIERVNSPEAQTALTALLNRSTEKHSPRGKP